MSQKAIIGDKYRWMDGATTNEELLTRFVGGGDQSAMSELIGRHVDFVYGCAKRQIHDASLAEDVTQAVFILLVRKASRVRAPTLTSWLFQTTRHVSSNALRARNRRYRNEKRAVLSRAAAMTSPDDADRQSVDAIRPLLDEALATLGVGERDAVILRYLQGREFADIAAELGTTGVTVRKRLSRGLARLRQFFARRGITMQSAAMSAVLVSLAKPAPAHLTATCVTAATAGGTVAGGAAAGLVKTASTMTAWANLKVGVVVLLVAVLSIAAIPAIVRILHAGTNIRTFNTIQPVSAGAPLGTNLVMDNGFEPSVERVIAATGTANRILELDTGRLLPISDADAARAPQDWTEVVSGAVGAGFAPERPLVTDCTISPTDDADSDRVRAWQASNVSPPKPTGRPPLAMSFRSQPGGQFLMLTPSGRAGILQVLGLTPDQSGVRVRYQLLRRPLVGVLRNGISAELVGVTENRPGANLFWRGDGSIVQDDPRFVRTDVPVPDQPAGMVSRTFGIRLGLPSERTRASLLSFAVERSGGVAWTPDVAMSTSEDRPLFVLSAHLPDEPVTFRTRHAAGELQTLITVGPEGGSGNGLTLMARDDAAGRASVIITGPAGTFGLDDGDGNLIAILVDGQQRDGFTSTQVDSTTIQYATDVQLSEVDTFEYRYRPYDSWIEFRNVAVQPNAGSAPAIVTSDDDPD